MVQKRTRDGYLRRLLSFCGISEGGGEHADIVAMYNRIEPKPRGYTATVKDPWCAIFLCALAWDEGFRDWPMECSCTRIVEAAGDWGIWRGGWTDGAKHGQWAVYDLSGDGNPDHIGCVVHSDGSEVWVVEGNYGNSVKVRRIKAGDPRVMGFVDLPYGEGIEAVYDTIEEVPEAYRDTIEHLIQRGALRGYGSPERLGLSEDLCRTLTVMMRVLRGTPLMNSEC